MPMHRIGSFHFSLTCYSLSLLFICPSLSFKTFGMFLAPPVLDLSCIRTLDLHLACSLHLLCWILFVFVHWIFDCFVSVAILVINIHASWILDLLCWILFVFFHWIFECSVSGLVSGLYRCATFSSSIAAGVQISSCVFSGFVVCFSDFVVVGGPSTSNFFIVLPTSLFLSLCIFFV